MADEDKTAGLDDAHSEGIDEHSIEPANDIDPLGYEAAHPALQLSHWPETAHER